MTDRKWYTIEETAEQLHLSKKTIMKMIREGELRSLKVGHLRRIPEWAIDELEKRALEASE